MALGGLTLMAAGLTALLTPADEVRVPALDVRLSDVADVRGSKSLGDVVIARLPGAWASLQLSRDQLGILIRRTVPSMTVQGLAGGAVTLRAAPPASSHISPQRCLELQKSIAAGEAVTAADAIETRCDTVRSVAHIRLDRGSGVPVAAEGLQAGDYLGALHLADGPVVHRGQQMTLASAVGPFRIERSVTARQSAGRADRRIFVQDSDGEIFSVPLTPEPAR